MRFHSLLFGLTLDAVLAGGQAAACTPCAGGKKYEVVDQDSCWSVAQKFQ